MIFNQLLLPSGDSESFFPRLLAKKLGYTCRFHQVEHHMLAYAQNHNLFFPKETANQLAVCIFVLLNELAGIPAEGDAASVELDEMGRMLEYIFLQVGYTRFNKMSILTVEKVILQRDLRPQVQSINDFELYGVISHFLLRVGQSIGADIQRDDLLVKSLLSHIKNMENWGTAFEFDLDGSFPDISRVQQGAEKYFYILENYLNYKMNQSMKDSIVIHICAAICRGQETANPRHVLISCPGSMATSKYLEAQVRNYLNLRIDGVIATRQIEAGAVDLRGIDFIISTVRIHSCPIPVAVVSPLLTLEDMNLIQTLSFRPNSPEQPPQEMEYPLLDRLREVYETGDSKKIAWLDRELNRVLAEVLAIETETAKNSALLNILRVQYVKIAEEPMEWRAAMELAASDLMRDGFFGPAYVEKAIENVEEYGSYIIVNQGIALAHANKESGVYKDGLSLLISREGIRFEDGETVYMLFFFSTKGDADYLQLFKEIIKLGNSSDNLKKIRSACFRRFGPILLWILMRSQTMLWPGLSAGPAGSIFWKSYGHTTPRRMLPALWKKCSGRWKKGFPPASLSLCRARWI